MCGCENEWVSDMIIYNEIYVYTVYTVNMDGNPLFDPTHHPMQPVVLFWLFMIFYFSYYHSSYCFFSSSPFSFSFLLLFVYLGKGSVSLSVCLLAEWKRGGRPGTT